MKDSQTTKELKQLTKKHNKKWMLIISPQLILTILTLFLGIMLLIEGLKRDVDNPAFVQGLAIFIFLLPSLILLISTTLCFFSWLNSGRADRKRLKISIKYDIEQFEMKLKQSN